MKLTYLVIHCTATPEGREITSAQIKDWHTSPVPKGRGWSKVGYSDMIHLDGTVENLVPYNENDNVDKWEITNGAAGINSISRHVVYVGGSDAGLNAKDTRTPEQKAALERYVKRTIARNKNIKVAGHNQFASKACPSFDVPKWCRQVGIEEKNIHVK
jgi:N-acetylmuramoyl-L-alanine amidase